MSLTKDQKREALAALRREIAKIIASQDTTLPALLRKQAD